MKFVLLFLCFISLFFTSFSFAQNDEQILVLRDCLLSKKFAYDVLASIDDLRLIKTSQLNKFQVERIKHRMDCRGFINVTETWKAAPDHSNEYNTTFLRRYLPKALDANEFSFGYKIQHQDKVKLLLQDADQNKVWSNLTTLTDFPDRYVDSKNGMYAAKWIKRQLKQMVQTYLRDDDVEIYSIPTFNNLKQRSIVAKIGKSLNTPGIVIGAHMDTLKRLGDKNMAGADDNASGVVSLLEVTRVLLSSHLPFKKPIYLIWYAGQEEGLLGSQSAVNHFNKNNIVIDAVLQLDETGYVRNKEKGIGLVDDLTDAGLTAFIADLVTAYIGLPVGVVRGGYACSDHVAWYQNGNRVAYPFTTMSDYGNPNVHTSKDTIETLSLDHMMNFVKLSIAFAVELAEPVEGG